MAVVLYQGKVLTKNGKIAVSTDCCCELGPCVCPPGSFFDNLCFSVQYTLRDCNGSGGNDAFERGDYFGSFFSFAQFFCDPYGVLSASVRCMGDFVILEAGATYAAIPDGCTDTSPDGQVSLCARAPNYSELLGDHTVDIVMNDFENAECDGQSIGSVTFTISEAPCQ